MEGALAYHLNMRTVRIKIVSTKTKIYETNIWEWLRRAIFVTHENVVQFQVIVDFAYVVKLFKLLDKANTQLTYGFETESSAPFL